MPRPVVMTKLLRIAIAVNVCVLVLYGWLWGRQFLLKDSPQRADLIIFYTAGSLISSGEGHLLYDVEAQTRHQRKLTGGRWFESGLLPFNYPPHTALPFALLAPYPLEWGYVLWSAVQASLLAASVLLLRSVWGGWRRCERLMCVLAAASLWPAFWSITLGNVAVLILFCAVCSWRAQRAGRLGLAGVALAVAASKPQLGLPLLVAQIGARRRRVAAAAALVILVLVAVSLAAIGWRGVLGYADMLRLVADRTSGYSINPEKMINLRGLAWVLTGNASVTRWVMLLGWLASLAAIWRMWCPDAWREHDGPATDDWRFALTCALTLVASPHLYPHDLCLLFPVGVILYDRVRLTSAGGAAGIALLAFNLVWIAVEPLRVAPVLGCAAMGTMLAALWMVRPGQAGPNLRNELRSARAASPGNLVSS